MQADCDAGTHYVSCSCWASKALVMIANYPVGAETSASPGSGCYCQVYAACVLQAVAARAARVGVLRQLWCARLKRDGRDTPCARTHKLTHATPTHTRMCAPQ